MVAEGDFTGRQAHKHMFFVYVLLSLKDKETYIGSTSNIESRMEAHNNGRVESTRGRRPLELIYYEAYINQQDATGREKFLKSGSGHRYLKKQLKFFFENIVDRGVEQPGSSSGS